MLMKRHLLILAAMMPLAGACVVDSEDSPHHNRLPQVAELNVEDKLEFPIVMAETALSIDAYEGMTPEQKMDMGYIYNSLIKVAEGTYKMVRFYDFNLNTGGQSLHDPKARWAFTTSTNSFDYGTAEGRFTLSAAEDGSGYDYDLICGSDSAETYGISIRKIEDTEAYYSWELEMDCRFTTPEGRIVTLATVDPVVRKVYKGIAGFQVSAVMMSGRVSMLVEEDTDGDGNLEELDLVTYTYPGARSENERYQF